MTRTHRFALFCLLSALPLALTDSAHAITQGDALNIVVSNFVDPADPQVTIFGPASTVVAGIQIEERFPGERLVATAASDIWFFFVDLEPTARYGHRTLYVGIDEASGAIQFAEKADWWPVIGGVTRFREYTDRESSVLFTTLPRVPSSAAPRSDSPRGRDPLDMLHRAPAATGACGFFVSGEPTGGACNSFAADLEAARAALDSTNAHGPRLHPDSIRTVVHPTKADLCTAIEEIPMNYDKIYFYYTGHGDSTSCGGMVLADGVLDPLELFCKLKERNPKDICLIFDSCFSGGNLPEMCKKGLCGDIMTAANKFEPAWELIKAQDGKAGCIFQAAWTHYMMQPHTSLAEVFAAARDSLQRYCAALPANDDKTLRGGQHPKYGSMYEFTKSGQSMAFDNVPGCPTMCFEYYDVAGANPLTCANSTLYCESFDPILWAPLGFVWECVRSWNWNVGKTRYFNPPPEAPFGPTGRYELAINSNYYPVRVGVTWPDAAIPDTPSNAVTIPSYTIGWNDAASNEFNPDLNRGSGGVPASVFVSPEGYFLCDVPVYIGVFDTNPLQVGLPLQPDFERPWIYTAGDPNQGLNGDLIVTVGASNVSPEPFVLQLDIFQPDTGNLQSALTQFFPSSNGGYEALAAFPVGTIDAAPLGVNLFVIGEGTGRSGAGPGSGNRESATGPGAGFALDFITLDFLTADVTAVDEGPGFQRVQAYPNPFRGDTTIRFRLARSEQVSVRLFDVRGRLIRRLQDGPMTEGSQSVRWDGLDDAGRAVSSGVYFYQVIGESFRHTQRVIRAE